MDYIFLMNLFDSLCAFREVCIDEQNQKKKPIFFKILMNKNHPNDYNVEKKN